MSDEKLPSLEQAESRFKQELRKLSKNELVRQASNFYMRLTLANFRIEDLKKQLELITAPKEQESEK